MILWFKIIIPVFTFCLRPQSIHELKRMSCYLIVYSCYYLCTKNLAGGKIVKPTGSYVLFPVESTGVVSFPVTRILEKKID